MAKKLIRLTESDLHKVIKESVNNVLKEYDSNIDNDSYFGGGLLNEVFGYNYDQYVTDDFEWTAENDKIIDEIGYYEDLDRSRINDLLIPVNYVLIEFNEIMTDAMNKLKSDGIKHKHIVKFMKENYPGYTAFINIINSLYNKYKWLVTDK